MSFVKLVRDESKLKGYNFCYGSQQFINWMNKKKSIGTAVFLEPVRIQKDLSDFGQITGQDSIICTLSIAQHGPVSESYEEKYFKRLEDLKDLMTDFLKALSCGNGYQFTNITIIEFINLFDENVDGISAELTLNVL